MRLYEIDRALLDVIESGYSVDEETGEILFEPTDLVMLQADRREKLEACAIYAKSLQAEADAIKAERDKLDARLKAKNAKLERMRSYILSSMQLHDEKKLETARVDVRTRTSTLVDVYEPSKLPLEYVRRKVTETPDKTAIRKAIAGGEVVPGACMVQRTSIAIK